jgi:hypothetical protein
MDPSIPRPVVLGVPVLSGVVLLPSILKDEKVFIILAADEGLSTATFGSLSCAPSVIGAVSGFVGDSMVALPIPEKLENFRSRDDPVEGRVDAVPGLSEDDVLGRSFGEEASLIGILFSTASLGGLSSELGGLPPELGGLPSALVALPPELGGLPSALGGLPSALGGLPPELGGLPSELGGLSLSLVLTDGLSTMRKLSS